MKEIIRMLASGCLFLILWLLKLCGVFSGLPLYVVFLLYLIPYLMLAAEVIGEAIENLIHGKLFDENFLMLAATFAAFGLGLTGNGDFDEAVTVMLLYQIGEFLEDYAAEKSRKSISDMMAIAPSCAHAERDGALLDILPQEVRIGDVLCIRAGERIPVDGTVIEGSSYLDTSALTGESVPRHASVGDKVLSGCLNGAGILRVRADTVYADSTVSKILDLVEHASGKKAKTETFITRFARYYTPAVTIGAVLLALLLPLCFSVPISESIRRGCAFLLASCPCALLLSIPLGFFSGIGAAARIGVLVKGSTVLEAVSRLRMMLFDKTGTLTEGSFSLTTVVPVGEMTGKNLLALCAYGEYYSAHPIAKSVSEAYIGSIDRSRLSAYTELSGRGICVQFDGKALLIGNTRLMTENGLSPMQTQENGTVVHVGYDGSYCGYLCIADRLKPTAKETIQRLKENGIRKAVMLTGDRKEPAQQIAAELGMDACLFELLPADKVDALTAFLSEKNKGECVGFVGDGINDAPVLMRSDVGFAMGALGSDVAVEAADVVIMDDQPEKLADIYRIAKRTMRIVHENIVFTLSVKAVILILSAIGLAPMWLAVCGDVGVAVLCVLNAMRNLRK